jgi:hypothetical protein
MLSRLVVRTAPPPRHSPAIRGCDATFDSRHC